MVNDSTVVVFDDQRAVANAGVARTLRQRLLTIPARLTRSGRRTMLRMPARWPWAHDFQTALTRIRALPPPG